MNYLKKALLPMLLIVALLVASVPAFAENATPAAVSGSVKTIKLAKVVVTATDFNGKHQKPVIKVYDENGNGVNSKYYKATILAGGKSKKSIKYPGSYPVMVSGKNPYTGTVEGVFVINKIDNPFTISATPKMSKKTGKLKYIKLKASDKHHAKMGEWTSENEMVYFKGSKAYVKPGFVGEAKISIVSGETKVYKPTKKTISVIFS